MPMHRVTSNGVGVGVKYLCLIYADEKRLAALPGQEAASLNDEHMDYGATLGQNGQLLAGAALHPVEAATTVRFRHNRLSATDGPVADTREQLAGFFMVEVRDLNDAIQLAARNPAARYGSVEVRPIRALPTVG
jgi:hypothetical protein